MGQLELLAPARDRNIGIAAIDCGADAVYIAGPRFGARQAAGNGMQDIGDLCSHARRFGARVFVTMNTILYDDELEEAERMMMEVQEAGADALIVQDLAMLELARRNGFRLPLHASTQCAIRTPEQAAWLESLGFSRLILERELSLDQIHAIRQAVSCELEFFVHGALCVCYSGQCYLSEKIAGRSANRGACIQACRSRYDLADASGNVLVRDKALLSLKDYNLIGRLDDLADAGITSFKIEGRLKNISYVRNVVRDYSLSLDSLIESSGGRFCRASFGSVAGGFTPDTAKTFNRGYTELFLDGRRGRWAAMDAAKSMGEEIGTVASVGKGGITVRPASPSLVLNNGDGFSFVAKDGGVTGFRGDVCSGTTVMCRPVPGLSPGMKLFRNVNAAFERELDRQSCIRTVAVRASYDFLHDGELRRVLVRAVSEDGRQVEEIFDAGISDAQNRERMLSMLESQTCRMTGHYRFTLGHVDVSGEIPFMSASFLNGIRRRLAEKLDELPCMKRDILRRDLCRSMCGRFPQKDATYKNNISNHISEDICRSAGAESVSGAYELTHAPGAELMRTRYCVRYELGMCPVHQGAAAGGPLYLLNNGQRFTLRFDCRNCEMIVL